MKNRWTEDGARQAIARWGQRLGEAFALRLYSAQLLGADAALVMHGGGNVSVKSTRRTLLGDEVETLHVKASGHDLATLAPEGLPGLDLPYLRRLRTLNALTDAQLVNELRTHLIDADAPTPSIETLLHAFLPHRYVDHSHADAVLTLTNQRDGQDMIRDALGQRVAILPYVRPGFELAQAVADCFEADSKIEGIVLLFHGLITFGDDARTAYRRHIELVDACETFVRIRVARSGPREHAPDGEVNACTQSPASLASRIAPTLRGLLAQSTDNADRPYTSPILEWRASEKLLDLINSPAAKSTAATGPLTCDHLVYTKPRALYVENLDKSDDASMRTQLTTAVKDFRERYAAYVNKHGGSAAGIDTAPSVVLIRGAGLFCWGASKRTARVTADIAEHTLQVKTQAAAIGPYTALPDVHLYDMEFRDLQQAKLTARYGGALEGQVVVISGGAGAIGAAIAEVCAEQGAHVVVADIDRDGVAAVVEQIEKRYSAGSAVGLVMNVTDENSVREGFEEVARTFGGVDVVVPNAGIAHVAAIEDMDVTEFRRVMDVNATGYLLVMREGIRMMKRQGLGGNIVISASKNVFGPGKDFGAYSASKAAGHQLGKVAAIELAPHNIRVNMINADAVFGEEDAPSGLWKTIGPQRAKSRHMSENELPDYYKQRNLLRARITGRHVGNAVAFLASNATPTTGATLPVDGGVVEAFPR